MANQDGEDIRTQARHDGEECADLGRDDDIRFKPEQTRGVDRSGADADDGGGNLKKRKVDFLLESIQYWYKFSYLENEIWSFRKEYQEAGAQNAKDEGQHHDDQWVQLHGRKNGHESHESETSPENGRESCTLNFREFKAAFDSKRGQVDGQGNLGPNIEEEENGHATYNDHQVAANSEKGAIKMSYFLLRCMVVF